MTAVVQGTTGLFATWGKGRNHHGATTGRTRNLENSCSGYATYFGWFTTLFGFISPPKLFLL